MTEMVPSVGSTADDRPSRDQFLVFGEPLIGEEEIAEVVDTLRSGWIGTGPKVQRLEEMFAEYSGSANALAVSSCTAGLHLALGVLDIGPGDEVIAPPLTFAATANVIVHTGATPVFADVDRETMNIDVAEVKRRITPRTKAVIAVHMAGRSCANDELRALTRSHGIPLIADAAHAVEARYHGDHVSRHADIAVFSFYATKNMTTAEGGMVTTDNAEWADQIAVRRLHGLSKDAWKRYSADGFQLYEAVYPGYKYNLTDLQAALGLNQLARLDERWAVRDRHWSAYRRGLEGIQGLLLPPEDPDPTNRHGRHLFVVLLDLEELDIDRADFIGGLHHENIGTGVHFLPVHLHQYYRETRGHQPGEFPVAEWIGERTVSLPLSAKLNAEDVEDVVHAVRKVLCRGRAGLRK
jgi:dTDP-4-amino-4,6-dideoxygalactose transaminase